MRKLAFYFKSLVKTKSKYEVFDHYTKLERVIEKLDLVRTDVMHDAATIFLNAIDLWR